MEDCGPIPPQSGSGASPVPVSSEMELITRTDKKTTNTEKQAVETPPIELSDDQLDGLRGAANRTPKTVLADCKAAGKKLCGSSAP